MTLLAVVAADGVLHLCSIADANAGHHLPFCTAAWISDFADPPDPNCLL